MKYLYNWRWHRTFISQNMISHCLWIIWTTFFEFVCHHILTSASLVTCISLFSARSCWNILHLHSHWFEMRCHAATCCIVSWSTLFANAYCIIMYGGIDQNRKDLKTYIPVNIEIIKGWIDKGQFMYLTGLKVSQEGLTCIQHNCFTKIHINILSERI